MFASTSESSLISLSYLTSSFFPCLARRTSEVDGDEGKGKGKGEGEGEGEGKGKMGGFGAGGIGRAKPGLQLRFGCMAEFTGEVFKRDRIKGISARVSGLKSQQNWQIIEYLLHSDPL